MVRRNGSDTRPVLADEVLENEMYFFVNRFDGTEDKSMLAQLLRQREVSSNELKLNRAEKLAKNLHNPSSESEAVNRDEDQCKELSSENESPSKKKHKLYYVHYIGEDRRIDEWVERERFVSHALHGRALAVVGQEGKVGTLTRAQWRLHAEFNHAQRPINDYLDASTAKMEADFVKRTNVKNIAEIEFGPNNIKSWYYSAYPCSANKLYICEYCLVYTESKAVYECHMQHKCKSREPPGNEIYRKDGLSVYEVHGRAQKTYCQSLCLLSKLFLDHKTLYFDVDSFVFYILCEVDDYGAHIVGHFSKELYSENNLACILVFPPFQRKGYGNLLIQLSYELSRREGWVGTPEKPLSDMGRVGYRNFWFTAIVDVLEEYLRKDAVLSMSLLAQITGFEVQDVFSTLEAFHIVRPLRCTLEEVCFKVPDQSFIDECRCMKQYRHAKLHLDRKALLWEPAAEYLQQMAHIKGKKKQGKLM